MCCPYTCGRGQSNRLLPRAKPAGGACAPCPCAPLPPQALAANSFNHLFALQLLDGTRGLGCGGHSKSGEAATRAPWLHAPRHNCEPGQATARLRATASVAAGTEVSASQWRTTSVLATCLCCQVTRCMRAFRDSQPILRGPPVAPAPRNSSVRAPTSVCSSSGSSPLNRADTSSRLAVQQQTGGKGAARQQHGSGLRIRLT